MSSSSSENNSFDSHNRRKRSDRQQLPNKEQVLKGLRSSDGCNAVYQLQSSSGASKVWSDFKIVVDGITRKSVGYVQCLKCSALLTHASHAAGTSNLSRHVCKKQRTENNTTTTNATDAEVKARVTLKCVEMCAQDGRPFNTVAGEGFKTLCQELINIGAQKGEINIEHVLPHPTTVSRNTATAVDGLRAKLLPKLREALREECCAFTSDMWSDKYKHISYLTMTANFITPTWGLRNCMLFISDFPLDKAHTAQNIMEEAATSLAEIGIFSNNYTESCIVTDQGANMKKAFEKYKRLPCVAHVINTVLRHTFDSEKFLSVVAPETDGTLKCTQKAVRYLKKTGQTSALERNVQQLATTRWNTIFIMLHSVFIQFVEVTELLVKLGKSDVAEGMNFSVMENLIGFLEPFKKVTDTLQSDSQPTSCLVVPCVVQLRKHCEPKENDSEVSLATSFYYCSRQRDGGGMSSTQILL